MKAWRSPWIWTLALLLVAGLGAWALSARGNDDVDSVDSAMVEVADVTVEGTPLTTFTTPDTAVGAAAPSFTASSFDGTSVIVDPTDGVARVIGFFAHWCPHCQAEVPRISAYLDDHDLPPDVDVIAVSTGVDATAPNFPPSAWFDAEGYSGAVAVDDQDGALAAAYGLSGYPYWVAVQSDGTVAARVSGELSTDGFEQLLATVAAPA